MTSPHCCFPPLYKGAPPQLVKAVFGVQPLSMGEMTLAPLSQECLLPIARFLL